jgi:hypothetical protein
MQRACKRLSCHLLPQRLPLCLLAFTLSLLLRFYCGRQRYRGSYEPITSTLPRTVSYCTFSFPESAKLSFTLANGGIALSPPRCTRSCLWRDDHNIQLAIQRRLRPRIRLQMLGELVGRQHCFDRLW